MRLIDADKLHYKQVYIQTEKGLRPALVVFAKEIRKMPGLMIPTIPKHNGKSPNWTEMEDETVQDVVPVVKCKDCVHYIGLRCYKIKGLDDLRNLDDFCSRGERREDGNEPKSV